MFEKVSSLMTLFLFGLCFVCFLKRSQIMRIPSRPHKSIAIDGKGRKLGYIPRRENFVMSALMDHGKIFWGIFHDNKPYDYRTASTPLGCFFRPPLQGISNTFEHFRAPSLPSNTYSVQTNEHPLCETKTKDKANNKGQLPTTHNSVITKPTNHANSQGGII